MTNYFSSIEMIREEFDLEETSLESIKAALKRMKTDLHPDRSGGEFKSEVDEEKFHKVGKAIEFTESINSNNRELMTISAVTDLTQAVTKLVALQEENVGKNHNLSKEIDRSVVNYRTKIRFPRIALTSVSIALSALWLFPSTVEKHPVLKSIINFTSVEAQIGWSYAVVLCILFWIRTWRSEELTKTQRESLNTEFVQNKLFYEFRLRELPNDTFLIEDLVNFLMKANVKRKSSLVSLFGEPQRIDLPLANATAEVIIERAVSRKAVNISSEGSISTVYTLAKDNKSNKKDAQKMSNSS